MTEKLQPPVGSISQSQLPHSLWGDATAETLRNNFTQIETVAEGILRLRKGLHFEPFQDENTQLHATFRANVYNPGKFYMQRQFGDELGVGDYEVKPDDPNFQQYFEAAEETARQDDVLLKGIQREEGKWWISSEAEKAIDDGVHELYRISEGENHVDLVNCVEQKLTDQEQASIVKVFNAVAQYTGGKIFDRISGIALVPKESFPAQTVGDYQAATGVLRINAEALRDKQDMGRYDEYFEEGQTNWFEVVLAHELGHPMDINSLQEADAHGLDRDRINWQAFGGFTNDFSSFQELAGWAAIKGGADQIFKTDWEFNAEDGLTECVPTEYAGTAPNEDFAETFAITVLGGNVSSLPIRRQKLIETVQKAQGNTQIGPKKVLLEEQDLSQGYPISKIDKVALKIVAGESH